MKNFFMITLGVLLGMLPKSLLAQGNAVFQRPITPGMQTQSSSFVLGGSDFDLDAYDVFYDEAIPAPEPEQFRFGYQTEYGWGAHHFGAGLDLGAGFGENNEDIRAQFLTTLIHASYGYAVLQVPRWRLMPFAGVSLGNTNLHVYNERELDASDIAEEPFQEVQINHLGFAGRAGIKLDYFYNSLRGLDEDDEEDEPHWGLLGITFSYLWGPEYDSGWYHAGGAIDNAPENNLQGFMLGLRVGDISGRD